MLSTVLSKKYAYGGFLQQENFRKYLFASQNKSIDNILKKDKNLNKKHLYDVFNESTTWNKTNFDTTFLFLSIASSIGFFFIYRYKN